LKALQKERRGKMAAAGRRDRTLISVHHGADGTKGKKARRRPWESAALSSLGATALQCDSSAAVVQFVKKADRGKKQKTRRVLLKSPVLLQWDKVSVFRVQPGTPRAEKGQQNAPRTGWRPGPSDISRIPGAEGPPCSGRSWLTSSSPNEYLRPPSVIEGRLRDKRAATGKTGTWVRSRVAAPIPAP